MAESLAAMRALLTVEGRGAGVGERGEGGEEEGREGEGEGEEEEEESIEIEGENEDEEEAVKTGREIEMEVDNDSDEDDDECKDKDEVDKDKDEDDMAVEMSHPLTADSLNRTDEVASNMPLKAQKSVAKLTRHNIHNVQERIQASKFESKSKFKLKLKTLRENNTVNRNKSGHDKWNGNSNINIYGNMNYYDGQKADSKEIHIVIVPRAPIDVNNSHDVQNRFNPSITHDKSLISIKNRIKFTECSSHLEECSAGMMRLRALINKDEVNLTLVVHEPEIWTRLEEINYFIFIFVFIFKPRSRTEESFSPFLSRKLCDIGLCKSKQISHKIDFF